MKKQIELTKRQQGIFETLFEKLKEKGYYPETYSSTFKLAIKILDEMGVLK